MLRFVSEFAIRKIALFFGVSATSVLRWIKNAHKLLQELLKDFNPLVSEKADIIELDEIYTYVKKRKIIVWTAYSRRQKRVIIPTEKEERIEIYLKVKAKTGRILHIYSDANSCYDVAFKKINIQEPHLMTKSETHLIESSNSSIRDNLARFNRKTKRYSKSLEMLKITLDLFLYKDFILNAMKY